MGAVMQGLGVWQQSQAAAGAAHFNSKVAAENAAVARQNAAIVGQAGAEQAAQASLRTKEQLGSFKANKGAGGTSINSGSNVDTSMSIGEIGKLDAMTIRSNATKEAYGQQVKATNEQAESLLQANEAKEDVQAGQFAGATTFVSGLENAAANFAKFQMAGGSGFGFTDNTGG